MSIADFNTRWRGSYAAQPNSDGDIKVFTFDPWGYLWLLYDVGPGLDYETLQEVHTYLDNYDGGLEAD